MGFLKPSNKAYKQAKRDEEERRRQIEAGQRRIEAIFSSPEREQQVQDFVAAQRAYLQSDLDREKQDQDRQLKFSLARSGLSRGSVDVDQNRRLAETYLRGIAEAENMAQGRGAQLRAEDQASKQQLFSALLGGADITTAAQNAAQMMRTNADVAKSAGFTNAFDSLFSDFGNIYKSSREAAGERRAAEEFGTLFGPRPQRQVQVAGGVYG